MVSLALVLVITVLVVVLKKYSKKRYRDFETEMAAFLLIIIALGLGYYDANLCYDVVVKTQIIEEKITMCQEENQNIEGKINTLVKDYMRHENETYGQFKSESLIELVSLFPDLKADRMVSQQIQVYLANEQEIKNMKQELIEIQGAKWLLYFGK